MNLPPELVQLASASRPDTIVALLATSSASGSTNVLASPFTDVVNDELILMPDLFAQKTKVNLNENRSAALSFATEDGALPWVLEGVADIVQWGHPRSFRLFGLTAGEVLDRWGDWDEGVEPVIEASEEAARPTVFAQRGVIVFKPERIVEVER